MPKNIHMKLVRTVSLLLLLSVLSPACKNKKKLAEMSDKEPIEEIKEEEEEKVVEVPEPRVVPPRKVVDDPSTEQRINDFIRKIGQSTSASSANSSISEALQLFTSPESPVLVVFYEANGTPSYDQPTTISKYLHYLKDTKNYNTSVDEMVMDNDGKVKELVLKKKFK